MVSESSTHCNTLYHALCNTLQLTAIREQVQSNCVAIVPKETELGRKRAVDYAVCNSDLRCSVLQCAAVCCRVSQPNKPSSAASVPLTMLCATTTIMYVTVTSGVLMCCSVFAFCFWCVCMRARARARARVSVRTRVLLHVWGCEGVSVF